MKISAELHKEISDQYLSGSSSSTLSKKYKTNAEAIVRILRKCNITIRNNFKIPIEKHKEISEKYLSGISSIKLAKEYKVSVQTILNMLIKCKTPIRKDNKKIPVEKYKELSDKYLSGLSSLKLAKEYGVDLQTILNTLRKFNVPIKGNEDYRKYPINENFFDIINTQEKAYFLGYLFADGCNLGKRVSLNLSEKDLKMLEKLNLLIHPQGKPLYKGKARESTFKNGQIAHTKPNYHLVIENKHIADTLSSYGCTPRKTNTLEFPNINANLIPHFIRGYFDGDGSVCLFGKEPHISAYISITSTRKFCEKIKEICENSINIEASILEKDYQANNIVELRFRSVTPSIKFLGWIYKDSTIHLERKYNRYQKLLSNREYLSIEPTCCICGEEHYGKGFCNYHYQTYTRRVVAILRAKKQLKDYLTTGKMENIEEYILDIIKNPPDYKITYRPRAKIGPFKKKIS